MKFEAGAILRTAHKSRYFTIDGQPFVVDGISDISGYVKMGFTLWKLFEAVLLCLNAVCVLHEERFLARMGWGANQNIQGFGEQPSARSQVLNLVRSVRTVMRIPLIFLNILTIVIKLILG